MRPLLRHHVVRHADRVLARSASALVLAVLTVTLASSPANPAGELAFQTTRQMARGTLALGETPEAELLVRASVGALPLRAGAAQKNYSTQGVVHPALGLPLYAAGWGLDLLLPEVEQRQVERGYHGRAASEALPHLLVAWRNPLITALTAWLIVLVTRRLGAGRHHAWLAGLTYALTTFAWPQARGSLPEVTGTFLLFASFHMLLQVRERFERLEPPRVGPLVGVGVALGLAWATHAALRPAVLVLVAAMEMVLVHGHRRLAASRWYPGDQGWRGAASGLAFVLGPLLVGVFVQVGLDQARFGSWFDPGGLWNSIVQGRGAGAGALELLFSPGRGMVWTAPLVLLAPFGVLRCGRDGEQLFPRILLGVGLAVLLPAILVPDPSGRWSYGPRPLLPWLPFLWTAVGLAMKGMDVRRWRARVAVALGTLGLLVQLPAGLVDESTYTDLTEQAGALAWGEEIARDEGELWSRAAWSPSFAAPWVYWRILRHRVAGQGERFPVEEIFFLDGDALLEPRGGRSQRFQHLALVDLSGRLGTSLVPVFMMVLALFVGGVVMALRGLDPGLD